MEPRNQLVQWHQMKPSGSAERDVKLRTELEAERDMIDSAFKDVEDALETAPKTKRAPIEKDKLPEVDVAKDSADVLADKIVALWKDESKSLFEPLSDEIIEQIALRFDGRLGVIFDKIDERLVKSFTDREKLQAGLGKG